MVAVAKIVGAWLLPESSKLPHSLSSVNCLILPSGESEQLFFPVAYPSPYVFILFIYLGLMLIMDVLVVLAV